MLLTWHRWRGWRRGRPFWGGLLTVVAGTEIGVIPLAPLKVMLHQGTAGLPTVVLAAVMVVLGLSAWFAPHYRGLAGVLTVVLAAAALVLSNLGGFLIGTLLGIFGGALIFAWRPVPEDAPPGAAEADGANAADEPGTSPDGGDLASGRTLAGASRSGPSRPASDDPFSSLASAFSAAGDPATPETPGKKPGDTSTDRTPAQD